VATLVDPEAKLPCFSRSRLAGSYDVFKYWGWPAAATARQTQISLHRNISNTLKGLPIKTFAPTHLAT
jgi:hypothetical protein